MDTFLGYAVTLQLEIGEQSRLLFRNTKEVDQRIDTLYQNGAQIPHKRISKIIIRRMTTTKDK